jgi:very-short-patch-repair endonuclease
LHRARRLGADQITELDGLPITRPERVPFDLANIGEPAARIERVIDRLWSDRLVSGRSLRRVHASLPKRGFRGTALMRDLLDARPDDWVPPASGLEGRTMRLLERAGLTRYERQVDIGGDEWVGRVDFVNRRDRIIIEVQSDRHHAALSSRRDDQERFARLRAAGYEVVPVWEDEVWHRPDDFVQRVWQSVHRTRTGSGIGR